MIEMKKIQFIGADGMPNISFVQEGQTSQPFTIIVSPAGLRIKGVMLGEITNNNELNALAREIATAWEEFRKLQKQLLEVRAQRAKPNIEIVKN